MGINAGVQCLDCGVSAPEIGDCGRIGAPSLADGVDPDTGLHTFGYLYKEFQAIGLLPRTLEDFREFLRAHRTHHLNLWMDGDDESEDDDDSADEEARAATGDDDGIAETPVAFVNGVYALTCHCGARCVASAPAHIRQFDPFIVSRAATELFHDRVARANIEDFHRVCDPLIEPGDDPARFDTFFWDHVAHGVTATLETRDEWSAVAAGAARQEASPLTFSGSPAHRTALSGARPRLTLAPPLKLLWTCKDAADRSPFAFEQGVIASHRNRRETLYLDLDGSVRWRCRAVGQVLTVAPDILLMGWRRGKKEPHELIRVDPSSGKVGERVRSRYAVDRVLPDGSLLGRRDFAVGTDKYGGRALARLRIRDSGLSVVWEIEHRRPAGAWREGIGPAAIDANTVFVEIGPRFVALDLDAGAERWSRAMADLGGVAGEDEVPAPAVVGGLVVVATENHGVAALSTSDGRVVWKEPENAPGLRSRVAFGSAPSHAVYGTSLFRWIDSHAVGHFDTAWSVVDVETGAESSRWSLFENACQPCDVPRAYMVAAPVITETSVFFGDSSERLWAVEKDTGRPLWRTRPPDIDSPHGVPSVHGGRLYFSSQSEDTGTLYCYGEI